MVITSNTGPLIHLYEAQLLELLPLAGEIHVPSSVITETGQWVSGWQTPRWLMVDMVAAPYAREASAWQQTGLLDIGEAEAIALARQLQTDWFLTDDAAARLLAQTLGLETHGSLGILLWAAANGYLNRTEAANGLDRLAKSSLWVSARVLTEARVALGKLFQE